MAKHNLKLHMTYFDDVATGRKTFEVRLNDRNYNTCDILRLHEFDAEQQQYTGRYIEAIILYIMDNQNYLKVGYVVLAIDVIYKAVVQQISAEELKQLNAELNNTEME